ncbi:MAG: hypothetical protein H8E27_07825 [Verrucomicrobia subdivision 3 bacterium]|nr:hypothetical protein [Limisphaerales bacterium]
MDLQPILEKGGVEEGVAELARFYYAEIYPAHPYSEWPILIIDYWPHEGWIQVYPRQEEGPLTPQELKEFSSQIKGLCLISIKELKKRYEQNDALRGMESFIQEQFDEFASRHTLLVSEMADTVAKVWPEVHTKMAPGARITARIIESSNMDMEGHLISLKDIPL